MGLVRVSQSAATLLAAPPPSPPRLGGAGAQTERGGGGFVSVYTSDYWSSHLSGGVPLSQSFVYARFTHWADGVCTIVPAVFSQLSPSVSPPDPFRPRRYRIHRRKVRAASFYLLQQVRQEKAFAYFVTLTFPSNLSEEERLERVRRFARNLSRSAKRFRLIGYVWVLERHKSGAIHAHFLIASHRSFLYSSQYTTLAEVSQFYCGSPNGMDVKRVRSFRNLASYLSKYVSKSKDTFASRAYAISVPLACIRRTASLPLVPLRRIVFFAPRFGLSFAGNWLPDPLQVLEAFADEVVPLRSRWFPTSLGASLSGFQPPPLGEVGGGY